MLTVFLGGWILVVVEPVDGRKGINSLAGVVERILRGDPTSGDVFVFTGGRGDRLKVLAWMDDGFAQFLR
jgi:transposase